jgi:hypothetical protein
MWDDWGSPTRRPQRQGRWFWSAWKVFEGRRWAGVWVALRRDCVVLVGAEPDATGMPDRCQIVHVIPPGDLAKRAALTSMLVGVAKEAILFGPEVGWTDHVDAKKPVDQDAER